jgi:hypothetical protein
LNSLRRAPPTRLEARQKTNANDYGGAFDSPRIMIPCRSAALFEIFDHLAVDEDGPVLLDQSSEEPL